LITILEDLIYNEPALIKVSYDDNKMELLYLVKSNINGVDIYSLSLYKMIKKF